jgi:citrate synthase
MFIKNLGTEMEDRGMAEQVRVKNIGLRGVTVADSKISFIDGERGVLIYRGYRVEDLAEKADFLETAYLLLHGDLPTHGRLAEFKSLVAGRRSLPDFIYESFARWPRSASPMDVLQASVPLLAAADPEPMAETRDQMAEQAAGLIARFPTLVAAWHRIRNGLEPLAPDDSLDHAANFLYMLTGERPDEATARDLDVCLTLHADHTFNASTFACREVVSTRAHLYAGVAAGVGALSGGLHGGANARVMEMLLGLQDVTDIEGWVRKTLDAGERIMGLGHAVYKTDDPRAKFLRAMGRRLDETTGRRWFDISERIERAAMTEFARRGKSGIRPNVDFNSAPVYYLMGIEPEMMTPVFAVARVAGWCAHIIEEVFSEAQDRPALYRPRAEYVGDYCGLMGCEFTPLTERGG